MQTISIPTSTAAAVSGPTTLGQDCAEEGREEENVTLMGGNDTDDGQIGTGGDCEDMKGDDSQAKVHQDTMEKWANFAHPLMVETQPFATKIILFHTQSAKPKKIHTQSHGPFYPDTDSKEEKKEASRHSYSQSQSQSQHGSDSHINNTQSQPQSHSHRHPPPQLRRHTPLFMRNNDLIRKDLLQPYDFNRLNKPFAWNYPQLPQRILQSAHMCNMIWQVYEEMGLKNDTDMAILRSMILYRSPIHAAVAAEHGFTTDILTDIKKWNVANLKRKLPTLTQSTDFIELARLFTFILQQI
ncbi:MAG: hypothetical protein GY938_23995, partial [Ketobacter sp.]|nr:hypothetical protein [Ketobacter sp.]